MHFALFYHSLISDWNHGNAHFLRGVATELLRCGHRVTIYEPRDGWSLTNLRQEYGEEPIDAFHAAFPHLYSHFYDPRRADLADWLAAELATVDVAIVHEWNETRLIQAIGEDRQRRRRDHYRVLFHDTHHRALSDDQTINHYQLLNYDGVLAFGQVVQELYLQHEWAQRAWVWHEAADTSIFYPRLPPNQAGDLVWIGNWGDGERSQRLQEFLFAPVKARGLHATVFGVRYPPAALTQLAAAGIDYRGWLPNYLVPECFGRFRFTVHIPRRPYVQALPGIPTIRVFEALACGIPLICSPWTDSEHLFTPGKDYLVASTGEAMQQAMDLLLHDTAAAAALAEHGLATLRARHTCAHRVDELLAICADLGIGKTTARPTAAAQPPGAVAQAPLHAMLTVAVHPGATTAAHRQERPS